MLKFLFVGAQSLAGHVAIVTGASSGIGASIAEQLAAAGAKIAMAARREEKMNEVKKKIEADGGIAICVKTDVTKREEVREMQNSKSLCKSCPTSLTNSQQLNYG